MRRRLTSGFPIVALAVCALTAPAWGLCDVDAVDPAWRCVMPAPAPRAAFPMLPPAPAVTWTYQPPPPLVTESQTPGLPPLPSYRPVWQETQPGIESHFDALFAAEAQSHWWKP